MGEDSGHYVSIDAKPLNQADGGEWESMPEPPPRNKTSPHARARVSEICEAYSQIKSPSRACVRVTEILPLPAKEAKLVKRQTKTSGPQILTSSHYKATLALAKEKGT